MEDMTIAKPYVSKVTPEGRVLIPANVRRLLGLRPGDAVEFSIAESTVTLVTPAMRLASIRARQVGPPPTAQDVRRFRDEDRDLSEARMQSRGSVVTVDSSVERALAKSLGLD